MIDVWFACGPNAQRFRKLYLQCWWRSLNVQWLIAGARRYCFAEVWDVTLDCRYDYFIAYVARFLRTGVSDMSTWQLGFVEPQRGPVWRILHPVLCFRISPSHYVALLHYTHMSSNTCICAPNEQTMRGVKLHNIRNILDTCDHILFSQYTRH